MRVEEDEVKGKEENINNDMSIGGLNACFFLGVNKKKWILGCKSEREKNKGGVSMLLVEGCLNNSNALSNFLAIPNPEIHLEH